jgi:hypothetical protein
LKADTLIGTGDESDRFIWHDDLLCGGALSDWTVVVNAALSR